MEYSLSGTDITDRVDCNLFKLSEIKRFKTIDELLKNNRCVLLFENKLNVGHWVCLYKHNNTLYFFDSYGNNMKGVGDFVPKHIDKALKQDFRDLVKLMYNSPYNVEYNHYSLQKDKFGVNTCGRWCIIRLKYIEMSIDDFNNAFKRKSLPPDEIIVKLTPDLPR